MVVKNVKEDNDKLMINLKKEKEAMETKFMKKEQKQNSRDWN
jgi:hypothetical protein